MPLDPILAAIAARMAYEQDPKHLPVAPVRLKVFDVWVAITGNRLRTFASHALKCSDPTCGMAAAHFAVERTLDAQGQPIPGHGFHLNLYGLDDRGREVLFTHDHTLARSLGGKDNLANTTTMCTHCNARKSLKEQALLRAQRRAEGLNPHTGDPVQPQDLIIGDTLIVRKTRRLFTQRALAFGLSEADYRAFCETRTGHRPPLPPPLPPYWLAEHRLAAALGLSQEAYSVFRRDMNAHYALYLQGGDGPAPDQPATGRLLPDVLTQHLLTLATQHGVTPEAFRERLEREAEAAQVLRADKTPSAKATLQAERIGLSVGALYHFRQAYPKRPTPAAAPEVVPAPAPAPRRSPSP
jgi:hypothetical protein